MTVDDEPLDPSAPLFFTLSLQKLVFLSIATVGLYEVYWMYRNWELIKQRDGGKYHPLWRGVFGVVYCHPLLRRMRYDRAARKLVEPDFSHAMLATAWVVCAVAVHVLTRSHRLEISILAPFVPTFACLVPVQRYANAVALAQDPAAPMHPWAPGETVCLVLGAISWALILRNVIA